MATDYTIEDVKKEVASETRGNQKGEKIQLIIFKLGNEEYGLAIDQIKEVVLTPSIAKVPQVPSYIKGVANIRGNIIAIMDLEEKFGLKRNDAEKAVVSGNSNYTLVVESEKYKVGVLVKEVPNTLSVHTSDIDSYTHFANNSSDASYMKGVAKSGDRIIIMIDMIQLTETEALNMNSVNKAIN
jgi:purine-binding chemotaxis protein CheW